MITDLALASHSILSYTLSSPSLLTTVLESHQPSAIVIQASMLSHLLEQLYEIGGQKSRHTIIVVGEPSPQAMASVASNITVLNFADVEREGVKVEKILTPVPSASSH